MTFLILSLLSLSALALLGAIIFLYRYLMRSHLFPQLPRVWRVEKMRFFLCSTVFVVCFAAFLLLGLMNKPVEPDEDSAIYQTLPTQNQPSFDGAPPLAQDQERVLPPRDESAPALADPPKPPLAAAGNTPGSPPVPERPTASPAGTVKPASAPPAPDKPAPLEEEPPPPAEASKPPAGAKPAPLPGASGQPAVISVENKPPLPQPKPYTPNSADLPPAKPELAPVTEQPPSQTARPALFSVCVASYASQAGAESELKNFAELGQTRIVPVDIPGKGRWYRICVGDYPGQAEAQRYAGQWRGAGIARGAFVVRLP